MSLNLKQIFGAALLTVAVLGGTATYLNASLHSNNTTVAYDNAQLERHAEVTVIEGPAS